MNEKKAGSERNERGHAFHTCLDDDDEEEEKDAISRLKEWSIEKAYCIDEVRMITVTICQ